MLDLLEKQKIEILRVIFIDLKKDTKCDLLQELFLGKMPLSQKIAVLKDPDSSSSISSASWRDNASPIPVP